jgi:tellurite resistance protein
LLAGQRIVQLRFLPVFRRLRFSPGFWAFTFSYTAAAGDALAWLRFRSAPGGKALAIVRWCWSPGWSW